MGVSRNRNFGTGTLIIGALIISLVVGVTTFESATGKETYDKLKLFSEVLSLVESNYVDETDSQKLINGAIRGMLKELDPHTAYMTEDMFKEMQVDTKGEFGGLGITIGVKDDVLTVIAPIEDTPAWRAGIKAGDQILKVDGEPTKDMSVENAVKKMRGVPGTTVTITVLREDFKDPKDFAIVRDVIKLKSVKSRIIDGTVGYVRITSFQERTDTDLQDALAALWKQNPALRGIVLDLRNNPGGLLDQAVLVSGAFLEKGQLVVYTKGRKASNNVEYKVRGAGGRTNFPLVVLVNHGSASASEIVAGALQDWGRGVILGVDTFGKGSVQTVIPLEDGSGLRLTTAKYYTPKGRSIQNTGIKPDITVPSAVIQIKKVPDGHLEKEKDLEGHLANETEEPDQGAPAEGAKPAKPAKPAEGKPAEGVETLSDQEDFQLQRALDLLKTWDILHKSQASTAKAD
jgi:carboxyl-terminal processing protease